jgi:hypothetical protein
MKPASFALALLLAGSAGAAQPPLPELRTEPTAGGSIFHVRNGASVPLTAFLIELVDYPGSYYALWQDDIAATPIPPGGERAIRVANMTVGAVPDYVKLRAALFADGSSAGVPEKIAQFVERRRFTLKTTRDLIHRLESAQSAAKDKQAVVADLRQWADSLEPPRKGSHTSQAAVNQVAARSLVADTAVQIESQSVDAAVASLRGNERALAASRPAL